MSVPFVDFQAHVARAPRPRSTPRWPASSTPAGSSWGPKGEAFERELAAGLRGARRGGGGERHRGHPARPRGPGRGPGRRGRDLALVRRLHRPRGDAARARGRCSPTSTPRPSTSPRRRWRAAVTPRTKALLPVHLYGHPADLDPLLDLARRRGIAVIEDACQAIGAHYKGRRGRHARGSIGRLVLLSHQEPGRPRRRRARSLVNDPARGGGAAAAAQRRAERPLPPRDRRASTAGSTRCRRRSCASACAPRAPGPSGGAPWPPSTSAELAGVPRPRPSRGAALRPGRATTCSWCAIRGATRLAAAPQERGIGTLIHYPIPLHLQPALRLARRAAGRLPGGGEGRAARSSPCPSTRR